MLYDVDEAGFELAPMRWEDRTVNLLSAPAPDGSQYGLVITREPLAGSLHAIAADRMKEAARALRGYRPLGERAEPLAGRDAFEAKFTWRSEEGSMFHHLVFVAARGKLLTFTATARAAFARECEAWMTGLVESLSLRGA